jgi:hypothetical protein
MWDFVPRLADTPRRALSTPLHYSLSRADELSGRADLCLLYLLTPSLAIVPGCAIALTRVQPHPTHRQAPTLDSSHHRRRCAPPPAARALRRDSLPYLLNTESAFLPSPPTIAILTQADARASSATLRLALRTLQRIRRRACQWFDLAYEWTTLHWPSVGRRRPLGRPSRVLANATSPSQLTQTSPPPATTASPTEDLFARTLRTSRTCDHCEYFTTSIHLHSPPTASAPSEFLPAATRCRLHSPALPSLNFLG